MGLSVAPCYGTLQGAGLTTETKQAGFEGICEGWGSDSSKHWRKEGQIGTQCQCGLLGEAAGW